MNNFPLIAREARNLLASSSGKLARVVYKEGKSWFFITRWQQRTLPADASITSVELLGIMYAACWKDNKPKSLFFNADLPQTLIIMTDLPLISKLHSN